MYSGTAMVLPGLSVPCAVPRQWALFELCGSAASPKALRCEILEPLRFASADPLISELRRQRGKAGETEGPELRVLGPGDYPINAKTWRNMENDE